MTSQHALDYVDPRPCGGDAYLLAWQWVARGASDCRNCCRQTKRGGKCPGGTPEGRLLLEELRLHQEVGA